MEETVRYLNSLHATLEQYDGFVTEAQGVLSYLQLRKSWSTKYDFAPTDFPISNLDENLDAAQEELNEILSEKAALEAEYNETLIKLEA